MADVPVFSIAFCVESEYCEQAMNMKVTDFRDDFLFKTTSECSVFYINKLSFVSTYL